MTVLERNALTALRISTNQLLDDTGSQQFQDEAYFTNLTTDEDDQNFQAPKCFLPWPMSMGTQQLQPSLYTVPSNSFDDSYISPGPDSLESLIADKVGPSQLQLDSSGFPLECQPRQPPDIFPLEPQNNCTGTSPASSPASASCPDPAVNREVFGTVKVFKNHSATVHGSFI